jgi:F-type H+-transporting ATPase subunit b
MPQLNPEFFGPQLVWLAITFVALYAVLSRLVLPRIAGVLETRQNRIADDLDKAEMLGRDSETVLAEYETALAEARDKAHALSAETHAKVVAEAERRKAELDARLAAQAAEANARIQDARDAALKNVSEISVEVAKATVEKLIGVAVPDEAIQAAVNAELGAR